jgi:hypothetical protein
MDARGPYAYGDQQGHISDPVNVGGHKTVTTQRTLKVSRTRRTLDALKAPASLRTMTCRDATVVFIERESSSPTVANAGVGIDGGVIRVSDCSAGTRSLQISCSRTDPRDV